MAMHTAPEGLKKILRRFRTSPVGAAGSGQQFGKHTARVLGVVIGQKAALAVLVLLFPLLFPQLFEAAGSALRLQYWDSQAYLDIAQRGYEDREACAFYPFWPVCIHLGAWVFCGSHLLAAVILANVFSTLGLILFYELVCRQHGPETAYQSVLLLLFYPGALFFLVPYAESLFFFLLMACLVCVRRKSYVCASAASFLLPLTRPTGIFVLPLLAWEVFRGRSSVKAYALCLFPVFGYGAYFVIMHYWTGNAFAGFDAQQLYPAQSNISRILDLSGFVHCFLGFGWRHDFLHSFFDRIVFIVFLITLFWVARRDLGYYVYALLAGLAPALMASLMSFTRYTTLVFPVFIAWGFAMRKSEHTSFVFMLLFGLQVLFLLLYVSGRWVG